MTHATRRKRVHVRHQAWRRCAGLLTVCLAAGVAASAGAQTGATPPAGGWSLLVDNDPGGVSDDQNYTGGLALTVSGRNAPGLPVTLDPVLGALDGLLGVRSLHPDGRAQRLHAFELGFASFTPEDITRAQPIRDDHPYGCLPFAGNTRQAVFADQGLSFRTTLIVGVLGTPLCEAVQETTHDLIGSDDPRGWDNQISDGGEPTARWSLNVQQLLHRGTLAGRALEVTGNLEGAVGFTTQAGAGLNTRWGEIRSPWWTTSPAYSEYVGLGETPDGRTTGPGTFLEVGAILRARAYNALLEGQFRDSEVTFSRSELRPLVGEAWIGITTGITRDLDASLLLRVRSREIRDSAQDTPVWLSLILRGRP